MAQLFLVAEVQPFGHVSVSTLTTFLLPAKSQRGLLALPTKARILCLDSL